jgi:hypothetical protein
MTCLDWLPTVRQWVERDFSRLRCQHIAALGALQMSDLPESNLERRAHPRTPLTGLVKVAEYREGVPVGQMLFIAREGRNLSAGGISFFVTAPPANAQIVVALPGSAKVRYLLAHIRNVCRVADARYFTCCQFIRQLEE